MTYCSIVVDKNNDRPSRSLGLRIRAKIEGFMPPPLSFEDDEDEQLEPPPLSEDEQQMQRQLDDLKRQIAERQARQQYLELELTKYPSQEELAIQQQAATRLEEEKTAALQAAEEKLTNLKKLESRVLVIAARVNRLEKFCARAEEWIAGPLTRDVEAAIASEEKEAESQIASVALEILQKRKEQLASINELKSRVAARAAAIRRGHQKEPVRKIDGFEFVSTEQVEALERNVSPRPLDGDRRDEETHDLIMFNDEVCERLNTLHGKLRHLTALRGKLQTECLRQRHETARDETLLKNSIRQTELQIARDIRFGNQLNATNASLVSTLQLLMGQLNVEHYGMLGGPASMELAKLQEQEAIRNRQSYRITEGPPVLAVKAKP
jgi:hypothetical protein